MKAYIVRTNMSAPGFEKGDCILMSPLASPVTEDPEGGFNAASVLHPVKLERGGLVLLKPLYPAGQGFFAGFADSVAGFFTFQQFRPFSGSRLSGETASIRRLVGFPGDTLYMQDFVLHIKPAGAAHFLTEFEVCENDYYVYIDKMSYNLKNFPFFPGHMEEVVLGPDEYFVLSDNRMDGIDSRIWGAVPASRIAGLVFLRYWPPARFSPL